MPFDGLTWRADSEVPVGAVIDYAVRRPEIDMDQIVAYGISGGGYLVHCAVKPQNEGADSHAIGTNLSLMSQVVFDWLDEVLEKEKNININ